MPSIWAVQACAKADYFTGKEVKMDRDEKMLHAVDLLVTHSLGINEAAAEKLIDAIDVIQFDRRFHILGHRFFVAAIQVNMARMAALRATLVAKLSCLPKPPLH